MYLCSGHHHEGKLAHVAALMKVVLDKQCKHQVMMFLLTVSLVCLCSLSPLSICQEKRQARVEAESAQREAEEAERSRAEELKRQETERVQSEQASERRYATVLESLYAPQAFQTGPSRPGCSCRCKCTS